MVRDIILVEKIYGADLASLKRKIKRLQLVPVIEDIIAVLKELYDNQKQIDLCFDIIYVNRLTF